MLIIYNKWWILIDFIWLHLASFGVIWRHLASFGVNFLLNCNLPILTLMYLASFGVQKYLFGDNFLKNWTLLIWIFIYLASFGIQKYLFGVNSLSELNTTYLNLYLFAPIWRQCLLNWIPLIWIFIYSA